MRYQLNQNNEIQECEQMRQDSIRSQDKLVVTLSSGALVLSLTIYEKLFNGVSALLLIITWICYFISLSSTLFSFITAQISFDENITCLTAINNGEKYDNKRCIRFTKLTIGLNYISIFFFMVASVSFIWFSSKNLLEKEKNMTSNISQNKLTTNFSAHPVLTEGLTPNQTSMTRIQNGLTPNTVSRIIITENSNLQSPGTQSSSNGSNK